MEGIVLRKTPVKERDLIVDFLCSTGERRSFYFFGQQGGGKKQTGSIFQLANALSFEVSGKKNAKNPLLKWSAQHIASHYHAYELTLFILLTFMEFLPADDDLDGGGRGHESENLERNSLPSENHPLYILITNAIYGVGHHPFYLASHLNVFISKFLAIEGLMPHTNLDHTQGLSKRLIYILEQIAHMSYKAFFHYMEQKKGADRSDHDINEYLYDQISRNDTAILFDFFLHQLDFKEHKLITSVKRMIFNSY